MGKSRVKTDRQAGRCRAVAKEAGRCRAVAKAEAGFTLVELAVVMIIIGLLIGGILKGQELIANAQITGTASAIKGIDAATTTFRDTYAAMPGDMINANTRLPSCTGDCIVAGGSTGNGRVDTTQINAAPGAENIAFWQQLSAADLITGIDPARGNTWGGNYPSAPITGGFHAGFWAGGALGANTANGGARPGHYLALNNTPNAAPTGTALSATQAARIDRKLDDGVGNTGSIFPINGTTACSNGTGVYQEATGGAVCDLFIRFQN